MRNREELLQDLLGIAVNSWASYMLRAAAMSSYDDADKKLMSVFKEIDLREKAYLERAYDVVFDAGLRPAPAPAALHYAQMNFCRPTQVASRWPVEARREAAALRDLQQALAAIPGAPASALRLCEDMIALKEESGRRVEAKLDEVKPRVVASAPGQAPKAAAGGAAAPKGTAYMPPPPGKGWVPKSGGGAPPPPAPAAAAPKPPAPPAAPAASAPAMPKPPGPAVMPKPPMMPPPPK